MSDFNTKLNQAGLTFDKDGNIVSTEVTPQSPSAVPSSATTTDTPSKVVLSNWAIAGICASAIVLITGACMVAGAAAGVFAAAPTWAAAMFLIWMLKNQ